MCLQTDRTLRYGIFLSILILLAFVIQSPVLASSIEKPEMDAVVHLVDAYCRAEWKGGFKGEPAPRWPRTLPCPGDLNDKEGFVRVLQKDEKLENGKSYQRAIETHPARYEDGYIYGTFPLSLFNMQIQKGDRFKAQVGLLGEAKAGRVRFRVIYDRDPIESGDEVELASITKVYDGKIESLNLDLSPLAGGKGNLILRVEAEGSWSQDRAVWVDPRIEPSEGPSPPLPTPTKTITTTPTLTNTPLTPSPTVSPTLPPSPTSTPAADISDAHVFPSLQDISFQPAVLLNHFDPSVINQPCPGCPEVEGYECVAQDCMGPIMPDPFVKNTFGRRCGYQSLGTNPELESEYGQYFVLEEPPVTDSCSGHVLTEHFCSESGRYFVTPGGEMQQAYVLIELEHSCDLGCNQGACISCQETDDGNDPENPGWIINDRQNRIDTCNEDILTEYYCVGGNVHQTHHQCAACSNRQCQPCFGYDGGLNIFVQAKSPYGDEDYCQDEETLIEYFTRLEDGNCVVYQTAVTCPAGCDVGAGVCKASCTDGIRNQGESGVDCGGPCPAECRNCYGLEKGGGRDDHYFSFDNQAVADVALDALYEYLNCLRNGVCRATLPSHAFFEDYGEVTIHDLVGNMDIVMEAVGYYVNQNMGYISDRDEYPEVQSAAWTVENSGERPNCPPDKRYCGDCEDFAILRETLMRMLGVSKGCAFCADYYKGYWGKGHTFNIVFYRSKWRIMDYGNLGAYFTNQWGSHKVHNLWNDIYGEYWCPDWKDKLGTGNYDLGCSKLHPGMTWNYFLGEGCPQLTHWTRGTYYTDVCP